MADHLKLSVELTPQHCGVSSGRERFQINLSNWTLSLSKGLIGQEPACRTATVYLQISRVFYVFLPQKGEGTRVCNFRNRPTSVKKMRLHGSCRTQAGSTNNFEFVFQTPQSRGFGGVSLINNRHLIGISTFFPKTSSKLQKHPLKF